MSQKVGKKPEEYSFMKHCPIKPFEWERGKVLANSLRWNSCREGFGKFFKMKLLQILFTPSVQIQTGKEEIETWKRSKIFAALDRVEP